MDDIISNSVYTPTLKQFPSTTLPERKQQWQADLG